MLGNRATGGLSGGGITLFEEDITRYRNNKIPVLGDPKYIRSTGVRNIWMFGKGLRAPHSVSKTDGFV